MSTIITGSVAYDNIMNFPGHFKDHILPEKIHMLNISFLVDTLKRQRGGVSTTATVVSRNGPFSNSGLRRGVSVMSRAVPRGR